MDPLDRVLSQVREDYSPDEDAKRRVRVALAASLAASAAVGTAQLGVAVSGASAGAAKGLAASGSLLWVKGVVGFGLVAALTATGLHYVRRPTHTSATSAVAPTLAAPKPAAEPSSAEPAPASDPAPFESVSALQSAPASAEPERQLAPTPVTAPRRVARPAVAAEHSPLAAASEHAPPSTMLEELSLLRAASQAVRSGRTAQAQRALEDHERRFPNTVLGHERRGLSVLASCSDGASGQERTTAERFVAANPNSPLAESIRKRCLQ